MRKRELTRALGRSVRALAAIAAMSSLAACGGNKEPPKPPDPFDNYKEPPKKPAPPPAPKCEKLEEDCKGAKDKKAKVAKTDLLFQPPDAWVYVQAETHTFAQMGAETAILGIAGVEIADPKKELAQRDAELATLTKALGVTLPKGQPNWKKKPDIEEKAGDRPLSMWYGEKGATRGKTKGGYLVLWAPNGDKKGVLGVVFSPDKDDASGPAAVEAFKTLAGGEKK